LLSLLCQAILAIGNNHEFGFVAMRVLGCVFAATVACFASMTPAIANSSETVVPQTDAARAEAIRSGSLVIVTGARMSRSSHVSFTPAVDDGIAAVNSSSECTAAACGFTVEWVDGKWIRSGVQTGTENELMDYLQAPAGSGVTVVIMHPTGRSVTSQEIMGTSTAPQGTINSAQ
jgi:hypothetical protein